MTHANVLDSRLAGVTPIQSVGPVLVALKPFDGGDSAVTMARWLAGRRHSELQAMSAFELGDVGTSVAGLPPLPEGYYQREWEEIVNDLRARVARPGTEQQPRVDVVEGPPGSTIASVAAERQASAIVIGTGQHGILGRFLYGERALEAVRSAENPVLVVPPDAEPPFERAIVAVDFSQASLRAAAAAMAMLDDGARLTLVHVHGAARSRADRARGADAEEERRTRAHFARLLEALPDAVGIQIDTVVLRGDAVGAVLRYTEEEQADLIACGRRRNSLVKRLLVGSVCTAIIRGAPCCVLVAPERPEDDDVEE